MDKMASGVTTPQLKVQADAAAGSTTTATSTTNATGVDNQYFYEDEVFRVDKKGRVRFGIVLENSEAYSSDEEDDFFDEVLSKGEIRIAWHPDGKEEVLVEGSVGLADRTLMPGDVVRRMSPRTDTQRGYCREINMKADVKILGTKFVVQNVNAERLRPVIKMPRDNAVCLDSWVGSTKGLTEKIVLRSSCGAVVEIPDSELTHFKDISTKFRIGIMSDTLMFYPGQVLTGRLESLDNVKVLNNITLKTNKKGKPLARKFTVESVYMDGVWVHWQCKALSEDGLDIKKSVLQQPEPYITGDELKRLKRLNLFESCMLQINDKSYFKIEECDTFVRKSQWEKDQAIKYKLLYSQLQKNENKQSKMVVPQAKSDQIKIKLSTDSTDTQSTKKTSQKKLNKVNMEKLNKIASEKIENPPNEPKLLRPESAENQSENIQIKNPDNSPDDWQTDDDEEELDDSSLAESSATTISTCSSPTPKSSPKRTSRIQKKQVRKLRKSGIAAGAAEEKMPQAGEEVVCEALVVFSTATVVWQDGTVESNISSTQLYPIHHLDDHEFFPGDFVLSGKDEPDASYRDYGVIQTVDHQGRTAQVKWFTTYTSADEPRPSYKGESEVSVYDLKDHPDFQYRPGTIVIRVANFVGEDASCTAGQIIDNYIDGQVKVWWVDGHISKCWPQDLFEVGDYEAEGFWPNNESDNDSWETESEVSEPGGNKSPQKPPCESHILANLERARVSIARLEEIFNINPHLQNHDVMRKLLLVYKACRYLDRLMNTMFFHEDNFMGLLERVRKGGTQTKAQRAQDQKNRLFNESPNPKTPSESNAPIAISSPKEFSPRVLFSVSSGSAKSLRSNAKPAANPMVVIHDSVDTDKVTDAEKTPSKEGAAGSVPEENKDSPKTAYYNQEKNKLFASFMSSIFKATERTNMLKKSSHVVEEDGDLDESFDEKQKSEAKSLVCKQCKLKASAQKKAEDGEPATENQSFEDEKFLGESPRQKLFVCKQCKLNTSSSSTSQDDSGNFSRNDLCDGSSTSYASSNDLTNNDANSSHLKANDDQQSISCSSIEITDDSTEFVCARLCSLLKDQLVKCLKEIREKYCKENLNLSEVVEYEEESAIANPENTEELVTGNRDLTITNLADLANVTDENVPSTPVVLVQPVPLECFQVMSQAPSSHKFHLAIFHPSNAQNYYKAIQREHRMLKNGLPPGVWVRVFEDRMDLVSVMIEGPKKTPYEDGMFFFDIQLGREYPKSPPLCHYISYCSDRLNPNLYEDGKVCVSLLGTWSGRDTEVWGANSTLLQVIVSIQGLILVPEPYFNEAGFEKQKGTQQGKENSRMYNEMVIIKLVQAMTKLISNPPEIFCEEIIQHFKDNGEKMYTRIKGWMELSQSDCCQDGIPPDFPLVPASRGFCLTLAGLLENFHSKVKAINSNKTVK